MPKMLKILLLIMLNIGIIVHDIFTFMLCNAIQLYGKSIHKIYCTKMTHKHIKKIDYTQKN